MQYANRLNAPNVMINLSGLTQQTIAFNAAVVAAGGSLTSAQRSIIDSTLVKPLLSSGLWNRMTALYPYIGGTAAAHSINLVNPGVYSQVYTGGVTHNANGITNDGATGWVNTQIPNNAMAQDSVHAMVYLRSNPRPAAVGSYLVGLQGSTFFIINNPTGNMAYRVNDTSGTTTGNATLTGFIQSNRTSSTARSITNGGVTSASSQASSATNAGLMTHFSSSATIPAPSTAIMNMAASSFGASMTADQITAYSAIIQSYQSALGRAV
jgi:hypothetical protein